MIYVYYLLCLKVLHFFITHLVFTSFSLPLLMKRLLLISFFLEVVLGNCVASNVGGNTSKHTSSCIGRFILWLDPCTSDDGCSLLISFCSHAFWIPCLSFYCYPPLIWSLRYRVSKFKNKCILRYDFVYDLNQKYAIFIMC